MATRFRKIASRAGQVVASPSFWLPLLLATVAFLVYWPSLSSDFVYDARKEILEEGFITSISNLPAVLSLKVLGMNLLLGPRPGQLFYLMLIAVFSGQEPFGYHLASNLLHAANVALLLVLALRLIPAEESDRDRSGRFKVQLAAAAATLVFALHPLAVESVSEISYSSSLLVTFFSLVSLLAATAFRSGNFRMAMLMGTLGTTGAFAAVTCKESGVVTAPLLIVYWFLFRRGEPKGPWLLFLGAASLVTAFFLAVRFLLAPPSPSPLTYLGGSFAEVLSIQPRLWVFMMGQLTWPGHLSVDYAVPDLDVPTLSVAMVILVVVLSGQAWLAFRSPIGALGVAIYWLGLLTVSNFIPLFHPLADRYYYLPLAGVAMQLLALMLLLPRAFLPVATAILLFVLVPLLFLTEMRQAVFANEVALWNDALEVDPRSALAHNYLGLAFVSSGEVDKAMAEYEKALELEPDYAGAHTNLGLALVQKGQLDAAMAQYRQALKTNPNQAEAHNDLGQILLQKGQIDDAIVEFQTALQISPLLAISHNNLGVALFQKKLTGEAIAQFQEAIRLNPGYQEARDNLTKVNAMVRQNPARQ